ncbi:hypothetical protein R6Q57_001696 [Mikania cordata]
MTQTDTEFYKVMFESLFSGVYVHIGVLEAMLHVLNEEEKQRAPGSPFRLFLTPNILPLPLLVKDIPEKQRNDLLNETMMLVLSNLKINHITKVDMIFIPIIKSEHVFLAIASPSSSVSSRRSLRVEMLLRMSAITRPFSMQREFIIIRLSFFSFY